MKVALCELLGYLLCEFSFRWFDVFDVPLSEVDEKQLTRVQKVTNFIGDRALRWGVYFYNC